MRNHLARQTRERILDAAQSQFTRYGFSRATMEEIAEDAGLGKASLYYYFPTKEMLFQAVVLLEYEGFASSMRGILGQETSASGKIVDYVRGRFEYFNRLMDLNILDMRSSSRLKPVMRELFDDFARQELSFLRRVLREGQARGEFRIGSVEAVGEAFLHVIRGLRLIWIRRAQGSKADDRDLEQLKRELLLVTEIFLHGISARSNGAARKERVPATRSAGSR